MVPLLALVAAAAVLLSGCGDDDDAEGTVTPTGGSQTPAEATDTPEPSATDEPATPTPPLETAEVIGSGTCLNVRAESNEGSEILECVPDGTQLLIRGDIEWGFSYDWLPVETDSGVQGWAVTDFLAFDRSALDPQYNVPVHPADTETGVAAVDALIEAVHAGDAVELRASIVPFTIECVEEGQGIGSPPICLEDEAPGTQVETLPLSQCEGGYARISDLEDPFFSLVRGAPRVFAVWNVSPGDSSSSWPLGTHAVIFALANDLARTVYVDGSGIVNVSYGCLTDANEHAARGESFLLAPPRQ